LQYSIQEGLKNLSLRSRDWVSLSCLLLFFLGSRLAGLLSAQASHCSFRAMPWPPCAKALSP